MDVRAETCHWQWGCQWALGPGAADRPEVGVQGVDGSVRLEADYREAFEFRHGGEFQMVVSFTKSCFLSEVTVPWSDRPDRVSLRSS
jgi:hypothetical protein